MAMVYQNFDKGNAQASYYTPIQVGSIKKGSYVMLKDSICKVTDYATSKPGKHGSAKAVILGKDIFTGKNIQDYFPTAATIKSPIINKNDYTLLSIDQKYAVINKNGYLKQDIKVQDEMLAKLQKSLQKSNQVQTIITVMEVCGKQKICQFRQKSFD